LQHNKWLHQTAKSGVVWLNIQAQYRAFCGW
jgi:hypothetical protein